METHQARKWRWLIFVSAILETTLFGGVVFGWGSLVFVLKQDRIFSHLCSNTTTALTTTANSTVLSDVYTKTLATNHSDAINSLTRMTPARYDVSSVTCVEQDDMLSLCFSVSSAVLYCAASIAGFVAYKYGTRVCRLLGWASFTLGSLLVAFTSPEIPWLLFGGLFPLGFGGVVLLITNIQVGTLFVKGASTVIAALSGLYDSSSVIMLFLKFAHENGFGRRDFFLVLCGLHLLTLPSTLILMPRTHFTWKTEQHCVSSQTLNTADAVLPLKKVTDQNHNGSIQNGKEENREEKADDDCERTQKKSGQKSMPSLKNCLLSTMFLLEVFWMALLQLRFSFFLASFNPWLSYLFSSKQEVSYYTNVSMYSMMSGLPISLLSGAAFDFFKHVFAKQSVAERRHLYPSVILLAITTTVGVLLSVAVMVANPPSVHAACILAAILRSFLYSVDANIITLLFPPKYFTALFSVCDFLGGAVSMLQYALVVWFQSAGFPLVNSVMLAVVAVTFVHPAVQLWRGVNAGHKQNLPQNGDPSSTADSASATLMVTEKL